MTPELAEFARDGAARVRGEADRLSSALVARKKAGDDLGGSQFDELFQRILEACAHSERGALDYDGCLKLLYPFKDRFASEAITRWLPLVERLEQRADISKGIILESLLGPARQAAGVETSNIDPTPDRASSHAVASVRSHEHDGPAPEIAGFSNADEFVALTASWAPVRASYPVEHRAGWDFALLSAASLRRFPLDPSYIERVTDDDEIWSTARGLEFAESMVEPMPAEAVGRVAAALINSRLRYVRPRMFLQFPESLVIQAIGDSANNRAFEDAIVEEIGYPFIRSLRLLSMERNRPSGRAPRRTMLADLQDYLEQVLSRLGLRPDNLDRARSLAFDPINHTSANDIEIGEEVRVIYPGLVDEKSGRRVFKALVEPIVNEASMTNDEIDNSASGS